jgi:ABC-type amino acid transport substrate-binding protein
MSKEYQKVLSGAIALTTPERFALLRAMIALVEQENLNNNPADLSLPWETKEFFEEMDRRLAEVKSGKVDLIPGSIMIDKLRSRASQQ